MTFNGKSYFIQLHSALKLKKLFSVRKAIFQNRFFLCHVSFCFLGKILLVSCIQMDFVRCKQSGYARLVNMFVLQRKGFGLYPVWKTKRFTKRSLLMPYAFAFVYSFKREERSLISIETSVSFVR